jgi:hypothetical protein
MVFAGYVATPLFLSGIVALYPLAANTMQRFREGCCGYCLAIHQMTRPMIATPASITGFMP